MELALFNSDILLKIATYLPVDGLRQLSLTCRRLGIGCDDSLSLIEETARRVVQDIATEEEMAALPGYDKDNWLYKYNYLQSLRIPLTFDQLVGRIEYVDGNRNCVFNRHGAWATAFSNNIMMAGKHYASFELCLSGSLDSLFLGVMRQGEAMGGAIGHPLSPLFYQHFTQREGSLQYNNSVSCCMYGTFSGHCFSSDWGEGNVRVGKIFLNWGSIPISEITGLSSTVFLMYRRHPFLGSGTRHICPRRGADHREPSPYFRLFIS